MAKPCLSSLTSMISGSCRALAGTSETALALGTIVHRPCEALYHRPWLSHCSWRSYRAISPAEVLHDLALRRIHRRSQIKRAANAEDENGESVDQVIYMLKERLRPCLEQASSQAKEYLLKMEFLCNPELVKQNNLLKGSLLLPHKVTSKCIVLVFAKDELAERAKAAGAQIVGGDELIQPILEGKIEFDKVIAAPNMMPVVTKAARILGPKGLMPSLKSGTITEDMPAAMATVANAVSYVFDKSTRVISIAAALMNSEAISIKENSVAVIKQMAALERFIESLSVSCDGLPESPTLLVKKSEFPPIH